MKVLGGRLEVNHGPVIISLRFCEMCKQNANRALVIRFRGIVQKDIVFCMECTSKAAFVVINNQDCIWHVDTVEDGGRLTHE